ncbi:MAG: molybdate ABC transporter substrate-binding protein [Alphaproteobacteria bacterium]
MRALCCTVMALVGLGAASEAIGETVLLHAAGSLRAALTEVSAAYSSAYGDTVQPKFGASGLLKEEIANGVRAEVFASANMEHPLALARDHRAGPVVLFARNRLCALAKPGLAVDPATVLDHMLDPGIKLGTSTPRADPSGDYAWEVFRKAEAIRPGAYAALDAKALKLTGGPSAPPVPEGRTIYSVLIEQGAADIFLTYCTGALAAQQENPAQQVISLPEALTVGADYGLTVIQGASPAAYRFALFVLSPEGQRILQSKGFAAPTMPR